MQVKRSDFPPGFDFGVATSSYQIEGHGFGGAGPTHWDTFAATPGNVVRAENGARACDHYHRFESDLDLVRDAGFDCYRFSTSWARVLPEGRGTPNPEGLDFYDRLTDAMLARGIKPCVTLYHWEMPSALADRGGWTNPDVAQWFADFAEVIMGRIGDRMHSIATINEPWCVAWLSHFEGIHAPGLRDIRATARAMHHVLKAHGTATQAMRAIGLGNLGAVFNMEWAQAADESPEAAAAAERFDGYYNRFYLGGVFRGEYPQAVLEGLEPHLPNGWQDDFGVIQSPVDWCGINYYTRRIVAPAEGAWPSLKDVEGPLPKTFMDWEIYPEGLYRFLRRTQQDYTGDLPIVVTENGMAAPDALEGGAVEDSHRIDYVEKHLAAVRRAIDDGVPVQGYYLWSLLDNYEWALGYEKRFGLVHVVFDSLERPKPRTTLWHVPWESDDMADKSDILAVVADIGGTNTRVALTRGTRVETGTIRRYRNADHAGLTEVLTDYLGQEDVQPDAACVAMAGPVRDGVGTLTNLDWTVDRDVIREATKARTVAVLNDLTAQGHALDHLGPGTVETLMPGQPASPQAARLVIGVGTGMNAAPVFRLGGQTLVPPSESGHITLPVQTEEEIRLMAFIARKHGTPGVEDVLSGRGFERVYAWLCEEDDDGRPLDANAIMQAAEAGTDPRAERAIAVFTRMLGRVAGNLALITLPFGGIFLCGGVARHFGPHLLGHGFAEAFRDKGRFATFMEQFPVHLVTDDYAALTGSACHLAEILSQDG